MGQQVSGTKEIEDAIMKMAKLVTPKQILSIVLPQAEFLRDQMRLMAPEKTGRLRSTIKVLQRDNTKFKYTTLVGVDYKPDGKGTLSIPALAAIIEYGASPAIAGQPTRKTKSSSKTTKQGYFRTKINGEWVTLRERAAIPKHPFIRPALDINRQKITDGIIEGLYDLTKKSGKELGFDVK